MEFSYPGIERSPRCPSTAGAGRLQDEVEELGSSVPDSIDRECTS